MTAKQRRALCGRPIPAVAPVQDLPTTESHGSRSYTVTPFLYHAEIYQDILCFTIYTKEGEWKYRTFYREDFFFTQQEGKENLSSAMLHNLHGLGYGSRLHPVAGTEEVLESYFGEVSQGKAWYLLENGQEALRQRQLEVEHDTIQKNTKEKMKGIREILPKAFYRWLWRHPLKKSRYLTYEYQSDSSEVPAYCSYCQHTVSVQEPRHLEQGHCPRCKTRATYIASGRRKYSRDSASPLVYYFQRVQDTYVIRAFDVWVTHHHVGTHSTHHLVCKEIDRKILDNRHQPVSFFTWDNFKQTGSMEWCEIDSDFDFYEGWLYPDNLNAVAKVDSRLWGIDFKARVRKDMITKPCTLFSHQVIVLQMTFLKKSGFHSIARTITSNPYDFERYLIDADTPWEMLGVGRWELHSLAQQDITTKQLERYRILATVYGKVSNRNLKAICAPEAYKHSEWSFEMFSELSQPPPFHRILSYLEQPREDRVTLGDWVDYYEECTALDYDLSDTAIVFPHDFHEMHSRTSQLMTIEENKQHDTAMERRAGELVQQYAYTGAEYLIMVPHTSGEIIQEGGALRHCVSRYIEGHLQGKRDILFLRRRSAPEEPFYTIEMRRGSLVQCRTMGNKSYERDKEVERFVQQWLQSIKQGETQSA